jgi:nicotinamidase-related amidase
MKPSVKPIQISPELAARCDGNDQAKRMDKAVRAVLSTPHSVVTKDTAKRKRAREKKDQLSSSGFERMADGFDIQRTAMLAMHCQSGIVSVYAKPPEEFLDRASRVLKAARKTGVPVIHSQVVFRPGWPEVSSRNKLFASIKSSPQHRQRFEGTAGAIHPALGPETDDIVVTNHRVSSYAGSDLEMILRAKNTETIIMFGIATSGVVLSTLVEACDADYRVVVIGDCCADLDQELHSVLLNKLFPQRADVLTATDLELALAHHH